MLTYLSYPMTGYAEHNRPRGEMMTRGLRYENYKVFAPHEIMHGPDGSRYNDAYSHADYIEADIREGLSKCGRIALDAGWEHSVGCRLELEWAMDHGLAVCYAVLMDVNPPFPVSMPYTKVCKLINTDGSVAQP